MRRQGLFCIFICAVLLFPLSACGGKPAAGAAETPAVSTEAPAPTETPHAATWQEQYDLGVRYLSEGNYQEAILAFTAAIEIDPKQAEAYVGRGGALLRGGEYDPDAVLADYETALALDDADPAVYLGLADFYAAQGDYETAYEILTQGAEKTDPAVMEEKTRELRKAFSALLQKMVRENENLTAQDVPAVLGMDPAQIVAAYGIEAAYTYGDNFVPHERENSGYHGGTSYTVMAWNYFTELSYPSEYAPNIRVTVRTPVGGGIPLDVDLSPEAGVGIGWKGICGGDSYETVLSKLGLDAAFLGRYREIQILFSRDGEILAAARVEPGVTLNGVPLPQIVIDFGYHREEGSNFGSSDYTAVLEFEDGETLSRAWFNNDALLRRCWNPVDDPASGGGE